MQRRKPDNAAAFDAGVQLNPPFSVGLPPPCLPYRKAKPRIESLGMYPKGNLLIPASHGQLEAILKEPPGPVRGVGLVCHPHPLGGGTMHNKVVFRAAAGLVDAGLVTLRFNFRGVGASTGTHDEIEGGREDVRDALRYLAEQYPG